MNGWMDKEMHPDDEYNNRYYTKMITIIQSISVFGATVGALNAGRIAKYGRRNGLFICNALLIVGLTINLLPNLWLFAIGKFIHGISAGFYLFFGPVYLNEFVPTIIRGTVGGSTSVLIGVGAAIPFKFISMYSPNISPLIPDQNSYLTSKQYFQLLNFIPISMAIF